MIKLPTEHAETLANAIAVLETDHNFKIVREWLNASFDEQTKKKNIDTRGEETIRGLGYAEALRDITAPLNNPKILMTRVSEIRKYNESSVILDMLEQADPY